MRQIVSDRDRPQDCARRSIFSTKSGLILTPVVIFVLLIFQTPVEKLTGLGQKKIP